MLSFVEMHVCKEIIFLLSDMVLQSHRTDYPVNTSLMLLGHGHAVNFC